MFGQSPMYLARLKLKDFRGFESLDLALDERLTVLVGGNGSGKSSVLHAVAAAASYLAADADAFSLPDKLSEADIRRDQAEAVVDAAWMTGGTTTTPLLRVSRGPRPISRSAPMSHPPICVFFGTDRSRASHQPARTRMRVDTDNQLLDDLRNHEYLAFENLLRWFHRREDIENQERVQRRDLNFTDPSLELARRAIATMLGPGFSDPRIDRTNGPELLITKHGVTLSAIQLSDGERALLVMAGNLARRLANLDPNGVDEPTATILIDEIELHLHPAWQRRLLPDLLRTFPQCQFIVSTHSPAILSEVSSSCVRIMEDFKAYTTNQPVRGRDANALLRDVLGVGERPHFMQVKIHEISELLDRGELARARALLDEMENIVGPSDSEVLRIRMLLEFLVPSDGVALKEP